MVEVDSYSEIAAEAEAEVAATINSKRLTFFRASLGIMLTVALVFIPINLYQELYTLALMELVFVCAGALLLKFVVRQSLFEKCHYTFVGIATVWSIVASSIPETSPTVIIWNALFLPYIFFLLGKRKGLLLCSIYMPLSGVLFVTSHYSDLKILSIESIANVGIFTLCIGAFCLFYEISRSNIQTELTDDILRRRKAEHKNLELISELQEALAEVKRLSGLLPICASCKKVRDDKGYWSQVEVYVQDHSDAEFSHGLCPDCVTELYPGMDIDVDEICNC